MPPPINDLPPGVPIQAMGAMPMPMPMTMMAPAPAPSLLDRVMGLFHPSPSAAPMLIDRTDKLERGLDALQYRSSHGGQ